MDKFIKTLNTISVGIFYAISFVYMFLSFIASDISLQHHYLVVSLLGFITANILYEKD